MGPGGTPPSQLRFYQLGNTGSSGKTINIYLSGSIYARIKSYEDGGIPDRAIWGTFIPSDNKLYYGRFKKGTDPQEPVANWYFPGESIW